MLFIWNDAPVARVASTAEIGGLAGTAGVLDISDMIQYVDYGKSSSISQLIKARSRDLQKLVKYLNGIATSATNILLSFGVLPIIFVLYSKDLLVVVLLLFILKLFASSFSSAESFISNFQTS